MKLMKVLVVALVAGSGFAAVPSQVGEVDGKAIIFIGDRDLINPNREPFTDEEKAQGFHLVASKFSDRAKLVSINRWRSRSIEEEISTTKTYASHTHIKWSGRAYLGYSLDQKTLQLKVTDRDLPYVVVKDA